MIRLCSLWSRIDRFLAAMLLTVALASLLPARGDMAVAVGWLTPAAIALLFFMHGAQLSPAAALLGARQWRLHAMVFLSTFVLFPLLGSAVHRLVPGLLTPPLWAGLILLTALPSTVQASIAFTSVAGGNVPAAVCSAHGADLSVRSLIGIVVQLLLPFVAGLLARPWVGPVIARKRQVMKSVDYGSILLIVYAAFSQGVVSGLWHQVDAAQLIRLTLVDAALLAAVITTLTFASRRLGFSRADEITIVFCGSKKSLANGVPIATLLFAGHVGLVILPVMVFQQIQLMVCGSLARRYAARRTARDPLAGRPATAS
jgi:sodium/bile acid cotransporter 7